MIKSKVFKRIFKTFISLLLVLLIVFIGFLFYNRVTNKFPGVFGYNILNVVSASMEDTIPVGSRILIKKVEESELKVGDVISFYSKDPAIYGKVNTHRIVQIIENGGNTLYVTKGDANLAADSYTVSYDEIVGRYQKTLKLFTKMGWLLDSPAVYFILIVIPAGILFITEVVNVSKKFKEMKNGEAEKKDSDEDKL